MNKLLIKIAVASATLAFSGAIVSCSSTQLSKTSSSDRPSGFYNVALNSFYPATPSPEVRAKADVLPSGRKGYPTYPETQRHRYVRTTAYSCKENEVGAYLNYNAAGTRLKYTSNIRSAAADWSVYPVGTKFKFKGLSQTYVVDDYGSALVGSNTIDVYHPNLSLMNKWGTRAAEIQVVQWGSWERSEKLLAGRVKHAHCRRMHTVLKRKIANGVLARTGQVPSQVSLKIAE